MTDNALNYFELIIRYLGNDHKLRTYNNEYPDLRYLIIDKFNLEDFGLCGGMGRCATCMVQINDPEMVSNTNIHLACQTPVDVDLDHVFIQILTEN